MARGDRAARRLAREVGENSINREEVNAAGNQAGNAEVNMAGNNVAAANGGIGNVAANAAAAAAAAAAPVGLEAVLGMLAQVLQRLPAAVPVQVEQPRVVEPAVEAEPVLAGTGARVPSYLKVMEHIQKLGTKFFTGGARPMEADEWIGRLGRNFDSIRCPDAYKVDIAVHYLEGDAHTWWNSVRTRFEERVIGWGVFREEFRKKYFPREAFIRLESAFIDLQQGSMTVREYEAEFNRLKKYGGRDLEDDENQVRRFMRGLRVEISTRCKIRDYGTLAELVEKAGRKLA